MTKTGIKEAGKKPKERANPKGGLIYIGLDIGSISSDMVAISASGRILWKNYSRTYGKRIETVRRQLDELGREIEATGNIFIVLTGSGGRGFGGNMGWEFVNEVAAQAVYVQKYCRSGRTVIDMGGQDSKLIFIGQGANGGIIEDFAINSVCAAGTGSFLDQQAQRLGVAIEEEFGKLALQCSHPPRVAGRCSVFAKSDIIHLQQQAAPLEDIIAGLCEGLAANLKSSLGCGREFLRPIIFTGGVGANAGVVRALERQLGLEEGELIVPDDHFFSGAIGAVELVRERFAEQEPEGVSLQEIMESIGQNKINEKPRAEREKLERSKNSEPKSRVFSEILGGNGQIKAYLGVDVGSISTNVVVMDEQRRVLSKAYLMTAGKPLEAVKQGLEIVGKEVNGKVWIAGAATTGSGRYLTGDFIGADIVINEITAQARGATIVDPSVDTIFEIGGQDSKYISLENGVVVDFEMNHACAAGTGSFLEEQANRLGINIEDEFSQLAFSSDKPAWLGERCTVFMESDLLSYQQNGVKTCDLVAGLSYSIVANYLNRVVGRRRIGERIFFQGGTAYNKAVWSAFEMVTGKSIVVPDHHEVTGALGAAAIAQEYVDGKNDHESSFRGFSETVSVEYKIKSFVCEHCPNRCEIKEVRSEGAEPLHYGSRCDRYNLKKDILGKERGSDIFAYRNRLMHRFAGAGVQGKGGGKRIGIPMALVNWQLLPLFSRFFTGLGFEVVLSGNTDKRIIGAGVGAVTAQTCFPVKVAYGHVLDLIEKKVDKIFIPSVITMPGIGREGCLCPYIQSLPYQIEAAFAEKLGGIELLTVPMYLGSDKESFKSFMKLAYKAGAKKARALGAFRKAKKYQKRFEEACRRKGEKIISRLEDGEKVFVLVSRPYNGCDMGVNLELPKKIRKLGWKVVPMDMLEIGGEGEAGKYVKQVYWGYGQKILAAGERIRKDDRMFGVYLSNFGCGPDSFITTLFREEMGGKPCLVLELDEHSADAGVITRLEAYSESLKNYKSSSGAEKTKQIEQKEKGVIQSSKERVLYVPWMGECSIGMAASFRSCGQRAEVLKMADEDSLAFGRQFTCGKECLPCAITTGDMLKKLRSEGVEQEEAAFFMPGGSGPCRFGMYNCLQRLVLQYAGFEGAEVISPNQDGDFYGYLSALMDKKSFRGFCKSAWIASVGIDLLKKVLLRVRPFAEHAGYADAIFNRAVSEWSKAIEMGLDQAGLVGLMESLADGFSIIDICKERDFPKVGVVGEIYVRSHDFANQDVIRKLEKLGAACEEASMTEWIYYSNFCRKENALRSGDHRVYINNIFVDRYQHKIEKQIARPLEERFGELAERPIDEVLGLAGRYIHRSFGGEAILSVGKMLEYYEHGFDGVVNVMPFGCMPSTIVSTMTTRISKDCGGMAILNLSFDGSEDATLMTRLEAFVEQLRQRRKSRSASEFVGTV